MRKNTIAVSFVFMALVFISACGNGIKPPNPTGPEPTPTLASLEVNGQTVDFRTAGLAVGQSENIVVTATYSDDSKKDVTPEAALSSGNEQVLKVSGATVTGMAVGTTRLTARLGSVQADREVTVKPAAPTVVSLNLRTGTDTCEVGKSVQATATAAFTDGTSDNVTDRTEWTSDNQAVATVNKTGLINCLTPGIANIRGEFGGRAGRFPMTVKEQLPQRTTTLYGTVYRGSQFFAALVPDALVEVVTTADCSAGLRTTTNGQGQYRIGPIPCEKFKLRFYRSDLGDQNYDLGYDGRPEYEFNVLFTNRAN